MKTQRIRVHRLSIQSKITLALVFVGVLTSVLIAAIGLVQFRNNVNSDIASHLLSVQTIQKDRIQTFLDHTHEQLALISSRTYLRKYIRRQLSQPDAENLEELKQILRDAIGATQNFRTIEIMKLDGEIIVATLDERIGKQSNLDFETLQSEPSIQTLRVDGDNNLILQAQAPIILEGELLGILRATLDAGALFDVVNDVAGLRASGETILAERMPNGDARFLTPLRFDAHATLQRTIPAERQDVPIIRALQGQTGFHDDVVDYREIPVFAVTSYLPDVRWGLLIKIDQSEAYETFYQLSRLFLFMLGVALLVTLLIANTLSKSITRPIGFLTQLARQIKRGEHGLEFQIEQISDMETHELAQAYYDIAQEFIETFDSAANGMVIVNQHGIIRRVNNQLLLYFRYKASDLVGQPIEILVPGAMREAHQHYRNNYISKPEHRPMGNNLKLEAQRSDGTMFPVEIALSMIQTSDQQLFLATVNDISAHIAKESELMTKANYDSLTHLPNRRLFSEMLDQEIKQAARYGDQLWVLFLDLDDFKPVNDVFGHARGDELLVAVANRLKMSLRQSDLIARLGGDEFVVLLEPKTQQTFVTEVVQSIIDTCSLPYRLGEQSAKVSVSVGIACYPDDATNSVTLLKLADQAMYNVKKNGKNSFAYFSTIDTPNAPES